MPPRRRRAARGAGRAAPPGARRARRGRRRTRRRRVALVGGLVAFGAYKMSASDAERIEQHTGVAPEELEDQELGQAMDDLGIERQTVTAADRQRAPAGSSPSPADASGGDYVEDLKGLAELHEQGALTDEEFAAKKKQILGLD